MDFAETIITLGQTPVSLGQVLLASGVLAFVLLGVIVILVWRAAKSGSAIAAEDRRRAAELETRLAEMAGQLRMFHEQSAGRETQLAESVNQRLDQVSMRLGQGLNENNQKTSEQLTKLAERLAVIDSAQKNITELSGQVVGLQDILANKQTRGAFGEAQMEAIIRDQLPKTAYSFQATLSNAKRPDCIVRFPDTDVVIAIDAKFPLEAFHLYRDARDAYELNEAAKRLRMDMRTHIKAISEKYIIPGETQETALMFVPSESIYADLHEHFSDVIQQAHRARVMIVPPNMLTMVIQSLQLLFRDAQMREQAGVIQKEVGTLLMDVNRLHDRVVKLQSHFGLVNKDIDQILISSEKVTKRGLKINALELDDDAQVDDASSGPKLVAG